MWDTGNSMAAKEPTVADSHSPLPYVRTPYSEITCHTTHLEFYKVWSPLTGVKH